MGGVGLRSGRPDTFGVEKPRMLESGEILFSVCIESVRFTRPGSWYCLELEGKAPRRSPFSGFVDPDVGTAFGVELDAPGWALKECEVEPGF